MSILDRGWVSREPALGRGELIVPARQPDMSHFGEEEAKVIDDVLEHLGDFSTDELVELSHGDEAWWGTARTVELSDLRLAARQKRRLTGLVPAIVGQTQITAQETTRSDSSSTWRYQAIKLTTYSWTTTCDSAWWLCLIGQERATPFIETRAQNPRRGQRVLTVCHEAVVYCHMKPARYGGRVQERDAFLAELNQLPIFNYRHEGVKEVESPTARWTS